MLKIVSPVFENLNEGTLRQNMPVETNGEARAKNRYKVSHLEALGRAFDGVAPWLNLPDDDTKEGKRRAEFRKVVIGAIDNAVDSTSADFLRFDGPGGQPLVDAAFFAQGLLRSKEGIWEKLSPVTQQRVIVALKSSRKIKPGESNWLMFSATIEAALLEFTGECNMQPIEYAISQHEKWYKGDGWYGDGANFHLDYYNSYVIQPMLVDVVEVLNRHGLGYEKFYEKEMKRIVRYAAQLERMISPEGTYPCLGRSMGYRFGCFQVLSQVSLMEKLPEEITPAQVRCALTAVIKRQLTKDTFDKNGWLTLGFCGHQPDMAESYVSTGSAYLCSFIFLPLGLPADNAFWTDKPAEWSSVRLWKGLPSKRDHAI